MSGSIRRHFNYNLSVLGPFKRRRSSSRPGRRIETFNECDFELPGSFGTRGDK